MPCNVEEIIFVTWREEARRIPFFKGLHPSITHLPLNSPSTSMTAFGFWLPFFFYLPLRTRLSRNVTRYSTGAETRRKPKGKAPGKEGKEAGEGL